MGKDVEARSAVLLQQLAAIALLLPPDYIVYTAPLRNEGFPLRMSGIDNSYKIDGDVLLVIHASIPPGVHRPTRTDRRRCAARLRRRQHNSSWNYIGRRKPKIHSGG